MKSIVSTTGFCLAPLTTLFICPQLDKLDDMIENNTDLIDHATAMAALFTNYDGAFKSLRFKPSSYKDNALLAHVSTNLHRQVCEQQKRGSQRYGISKHRFWFYHFVSFLFHPSLTCTDQ